MTKATSSTRKRVQQFISQNDPRWDVRIGIPTRHLAELLVLHRPNVADQLQGKGGVADA